MTTTTRNDIEKLYVAYFNRPADFAGLAYWEQVVDGAKGQTAAVSAAFAASAEYKAAYAAMRSDMVVGTIYQNLFNRAAEPAGVAYWAGLLDAGTLTIDSIVANISAGALGSDKATFDKKVAVALAFTNALGAEPFLHLPGPSLQAGKTFLNKISAATVLSEVLDPQALKTAIENLLPGQNYVLNTQLETLTGTNSSDIFTAPHVNGINTLQSGDFLIGGPGTDELRAQLADMRTPITVETLSVETVAIQAGPGSAAFAGKSILIDAERMGGVTQWESTRSSADLIIEDVHIGAPQSTSDIRLVMRETAAGDTDFGVYFDPAALRGALGKENSLHLQLMRKETPEDSALVGNMGFNGLAFYVNGVLHMVRSEALDAARTYADLALALKTAIAATPGLEKLQVALGSAFEVSSPLGQVRLGTEIVITSTDNALFAANGVAGYLATPGFPPIAGQTMGMSTPPDPRGEPVTASIILDDVGLGGIGGDLRVDGLSAGEAAAKGVARFQIEVQDNSRLQVISGGKDLSEIFLSNGATTSHDGLAKLRNQGDLSVMGGSGTDAELLPGTPAGQSKAIGFADLRVLDASAMIGKFSYTAAITKAAAAHYLTSATQADFLYSGGGSDDSMDISIGGSVLASNINKLLHGDFDLQISGGAGNDVIILNMLDDVNDWSEAQHALDNVLIKAGDGDDIVRLSGSGDVVVQLGAGKDVLALSSARFGTVTVSDFGIADKLNLSNFGGRGAAFAGTLIGKADESITVQLQTDANDAASKVAALFPDLAQTISHLFIAVDSANVGHIYSVSDTAGTEVVATLVGSIDLGTTAWTGLTGANFL